MAQGKGSKNGYLTSLKDSEKVYRELIDAYCERVEKDHSLFMNHGIYYDGKLREDLVWARGDAIDDFQTFLDLAEESGILPEWWRFENRAECLTKAVDKSGSGNIFGRFNDQEVSRRIQQDRSGQRNALRILAELVVGFHGNGRDVTGAVFEDFKQRLDANPADVDRLLCGLKIHMRDEADTIKMIERMSKVPGTTPGDSGLESASRLSLEDFEALNLERKNNNKESNK